MEEGVYVLVPGKIAEFFSLIQTIGVPPKFTREDLETLGFKSKNDRGLLTLLKFLEFTDSSGVPTPVYNEYRDKTVAPKVLAGAIRKAYPTLFSTFPDAPSRGNDALKNFFSSKMKASGESAVRMVGTFKALCAIADFDGSLTTEVASDFGSGIKVMDVGGKVKAASTPRPFQQPVVVNVNIQLTLPETKDPEVYNNLFTALRKYVINQENEAD